MSRRSFAVSKGERLFECISYIALTLLGLLTLFPFYITIINSISPPEDFIFKDIIFWPSRLELGYYKFILGENSNLLLAYRVTLFITVVGTAINMVVTSITGFVLAQKKLPYRSGITFFMVFTMFFSGGMIPSYIVVQNLHLIDTLWAMIIPGLISVMNVLFMRNFIMTIPEEILESATIDGCTEIGLIWKIIVPLSAPAIATFTLFYAVQHWNEFYNGVIYITDYKKQPLQVYLRQVLYDVTIQGDETAMEKMYSSGGGFTPPSEAIKAANITATMLPIIMVYPFLQKYFVKGMTMGSLKG